MNKNKSDQQGRASFIISTARSGSTLLRYVLDSHPKISSPGELFLGQLCQSLFVSLSSTKGQIAAAAGRTDANLIVLSEVRRIVMELMDSYICAKDKSLWCEKTPSNVNNLKLLGRVFPDAKYICLYRNCMDVVHSHIEANREGWYPDLVRYIHRNPENVIDAMVESWTDKTSQILEFEQANPENCFRLKYESLVLKPVETLGPLFEFLGVEWDPAILDTVFSTPHDGGFGDIKIKFSQKIMRNTIGKGSKLSRRAISSDLLDKMNDLLTKLGYSVVDASWDVAPSPYRAELKDEHDQYGNALRQVFTSYIPQQVKSQVDRVWGLTGKLKFIVPELGGIAWMVDLSGEPGHPIAANSPADCTIMISADDLIDVVSGKSNAGESFLQGKVKIGGNLALANLACQIFFQHQPLTQIGLQE